MSVNNMDVSGFFATSEITEADIVGGLYDNAELRTYVYNWSDTSDGAMKPLRGWTGVISRSGHGFKTEFRSMLQALQQTVGSLVSKNCKSDFGAVGNTLTAGCNYPINPPVWTALTDFSTQIGGSGATIYARPNGHGLWDGGGLEDGNKNNVIVSGGHGYVNPVLSASYILGTSHVVVYAYSVTVVAGVITNFEFPPTAEGSKPAISTVVISVQDIIPSLTHVKPTTPNGWQFEASGTGSTGASEPTWPTTEGATVVDGGITWTARRAATRTGDVVSAASRKTFVVDGILGDLTANTGGTSSGGFFAKGKITFSGGLNNGFTRDIDTFTFVSGDDYTVVLYEPFPFDIAVNDPFTIVMGCDKTPETCKRLRNFINFRGEPHVPGTDVLFKVNTRI